jgi:hypothetical protein
MTQTSVPQLATSILSRSPWARRSTPWSLVELKLNEAEWREVHDCFRTLTPDAWQRAISGLAPAATVAEQIVTGQPLYGFYLLLLISETARRNAWEGSLWAQVRRSLSTNAALTQQLFDAGGQPSVPTKMMIERAARRFGLRHAFDIPTEEGPGHQWYTTVFLQFGFSVRGFTKNAPLWGRNINLPKSVRLLLGHEANPGALGKMTSPSFNELWQTIRLAARKVLPRADAMRRLEASPWIPPGGASELLDAIEHTDWSDLENTSSTSASAEDMPSDTFIGRHWWSFRGGIPQVLAELSGLAALELSQPFYDILIDGKRIGRLLTADQSLRLIGAPHNVVSAADFIVKIPSPLRPQLRASLLDPSGAARAEQVLSLWSTESAVAVVVPGDSSSRTVETGESLPVSGPVLIIADQACRAEPPAECLPLDDGRSVAYIVTAEAARATRIMLADTVAWQTEASIGRTTHGTLQLRVTPHARGHFRESDAVEITIEATGGLTPTAVWCGGKPYAPTRSAAGAASFRVSYLMGSVPGDIELLVVLTGSGGQIAVRRIREQIPVSGLFRFVKGQIKSTELDRPITRGSLLRGTYFFMPPDTEDNDPVDRREWFVFEGTRPLARFPARAQPRFPVVGLGAPLHVQRGPLNALREIALAPEVVDFGEMRPTHNFEPDNDGAISVQVQDALLDRLDEYRCVVWDASGTLSSGIIADQGAAGADGFVTIRLLPSVACPAPVAVALCYHGLRVGAGWTKSWFRSIPALVAQRAPLYAAAILRWFHLPVLSPRAQDQIRSTLLELDPAELIRGWSVPLELLTDDKELTLMLPDEGLIQAGLSDSAWFGALREVTADWGPRPDAVERFIDALSSDLHGHELEPTPLIATTLRLLRLHPYLALRSLQTYALSCLNRTGIKRLEEDLALRIAGVPNTREVGLVVAELAEQGSRSLSALLAQPIDSVFIREASRNRPDERDGERTWTHGGRPVSAQELLCQIDTGRRLLTLTAMGYS